MYHIAASIRSKVTRGSSFVVPVYTTSIAVRVYPRYAQQATLSLSMFATGTTLNNSNPPTTSSSNEQRRPFWATRPTEDESTKSSNMINSVDHNVKLAAAVAGLTGEDVDKAVGKTKAKKEKAPKKAATTKMKAKAAADDDDDEDEDDSSSPTLETDYVSTNYMSKVISVNNDITQSKAKRIVDEIFDMVIDVRLFSFYSFTMIPYL
jgi:ribosomal protein L12E/L44/L45/RPP1/RPP2